MANFVLSSRTARTLSQAWLRISKATGFPGAASVRGVRSSMLTIASAPFLVLANVYNSCNRSSSVSAELATKRSAGHEGEGGIVSEVGRFAAWRYLRRMALIKVGIRSVILLVPLASSGKRIENV